MGFSSYNPHDRYRRRSTERVLAVFVILAVIGISAGLGFFMGHESGMRESKVLNDEIKALTAERDDLQETVMELGANAATASIRLEALQETFDEKVPAGGPIESLIALVHEKVKEGMDPERIAFLIRSGQPPRNCTEPASKNFVVRTDAYEGPESFVDIAEGAIIIKGKGASARNEQGEPAMWYDSTKPVELRFVVGEEEKLKSGIMPLYQTIVAGEREYRFTISEGAQSFAKVTFDSCDYP